jgi:hypothetical protein
MRPLVGFAGRARSGKDTAALALCEEAGYTKMAFANPIRAGVMAIFGLQPQHFQDELKEQIIKGIGYSPRRLMQLLGTEFGRNTLRPGIWLDLFERDYERLRAQGAKVVVSDVRFPNEADRIRSLGGIIIYVHRPNLPEVEQHESESSFSPHWADLEIVNDQSTKALRTQVLALV